MGQSNSALSKSQLWTAIVKKPGRGNLTDADLKRIEDAYIGAFNLNDTTEALHHLNQGPAQPSAVAPIYPVVDEALANKNFFSMNLSDPSDYLDTKEDALHPIFHFKNFDTSLLGKDEARKAWEEMASALALASKWLSAPEAQEGFWHHLMLGELTTDKNTGKSYLARSILEDDISGASKTFSAELRRLADNVTFYWIPSSTSGGKVNVYEGLCTYNLKSVLVYFDQNLGKEIWNRSDTAARKYLTAYKPRIGLSTTLLYHLLQPALRSGDRCADMRYQIAIAKTLCHELCHALYRGRNLGEEKEPYMSLSDELPETGISWEFFLGGSRFHVKNGTKYIGRLDACTSQFMMSYPTISAPVPMEWVELWFRKGTWEAGRKDFRLGNLWGKAPQAVGVPGPREFIVHRYAPNKVVGTPGVFKEVLYVNKQVNAPVQARGKVDGPADGQALQDWYAVVSQNEANKAKAEGFDVKQLSGPWGVYEELLKP